MTKLTRTVHCTNLNINMITAISINPYVLLNAKEFLPRPVVHSSQSNSPQSTSILPVPIVNPVCFGDVSAVITLVSVSCHVMSITYHVLVLFSLASVKIQLFAIKFSALASGGCLGEGRTMLAVRQEKQST